MKVKELISILYACNQDADVWVADDNGSEPIRNVGVWATPNGILVYICGPDTPQWIQNSPKQEKF